jgi:lipopolysaccharide assembly protein A
MQVLRWVVGAALFMALLFLSLQNSELVTLKFYHWWSWQAPLIFIVLLAFALGVAAGLLAGALRAARLKRQLNRLRREHRHEAPAPAPDWSRAGGVPGAAPASGPGYARGDRPVDGV